MVLQIAALLHSSGPIKSIRWANRSLLANSVKIYNVLRPFSNWFRPDVSTLLSRRDTKRLVELALGVYNARIRKGKDPVGFGSGMRPPGERKAACKALASIGDNTVVREIMPLLEGKHRLYISDTPTSGLTSAITLLANVRTVEAFEALVQVLQGELPLTSSGQKYPSKCQDEFKCAAADALGYIGDSKAARALCEAVVDEDRAYLLSGSGLNWAIFHALRNIGDPIPVEVLCAVLKTECNAKQITGFGEKAREELDQAILAHGANAVDALCSLLRSFASKTEMRRSGESNDYSEFNKNSAAMSSIIRLLGKIKVKTAVAPLCELFDSGNPRFRAGVEFSLLSVLGSIGDASAIPCLTQVSEVIG